MRTCSRGSIPACAGEPPGAARIPLPRKVYPRVCGGTIPSNIDGTPVQGLSPRVRGNRTHEPVNTARLTGWVYPRVCGGTCGMDVRLCLRLIGSIPACAGEPDRNRSVSRILNIRGLSPRVRGNLAPTPYRRPTIQARVYPRVCGGTAFRNSP